MSPSPIIRHLYQIDRFCFDLRLKEAFANNSASDWSRPYPQIFKIIRSDGVDFLALIVLSFWRRS